MTATTTESRTGQGATLNGPSHLEVIQFLTQPTPVDVSDTLVRLWAESTPVDAENGYAQQARILAAILDRPVNPFVVQDAMEAAAALWKLGQGWDLNLLYDGWANTEANRQNWLAVESENLAIAVRELGGTR